MVLLSVGQHLSLWPAIKTLSPDREKLQSNYSKFSDVNHLFFAQSFIWYLTGNSKYSGNAMSELKWILNDKRNTIYSDYAIRKYQTFISSLVITYSYINSEMR